MTTARTIPIDRPHLRNDIGMLRVPDPDLVDKTVYIDIDVSRYASDKGAYIYVSERGGCPLFRLRPKHARELVAYLEAAIRAAKVQDTVTLPAGAAE